MARRSLGFAPKTILSKWSVGLIIAMFVLFFLGSSFTSWLYEGIPSGDTLLADIAARPAIGLTMLTGMASGVASFVTGLLAIIKLKERSLLVYISTVIGALVTIFLIAEMIFPE